MNSEGNQYRRILAHWDMFFITLILIDPKSIPAKTGSLGCVHPSELCVYNCIVNQYRLTGVMAGLSKINLIKCFGHFV